MGSFASFDTFAMRRAISCITRSGAASSSFSFVTCSLCHMERENANENGVVSQPPPATEESVSAAAPGTHLLGEDEAAQEAGALLW